MYAAAFFEKDPVKIVEAGLRCIPAESQYAEAVKDVLDWYALSPNNWLDSWQKIEQKYNDNPDYRRASCNDPDENFNIDAKINGAYIVMGLLYGQGDPDRTIIVSTQCGQDSDCNPSNAAGILFTTMGWEKLPPQFTSALNRETVFDFTEYNFAKLTKVCEELVRQAVQRSGGRIEKDANGEEVLVIPVQQPKPSKLETCWEPGPAANSRFDEAERAKIAVKE
jgi:hypothetical protein